jgi:hypothetical protein
MAMLVRKCFSIHIKYFKLSKCNLLLLVLLPVKKIILSVNIIPIPVHDISSSFYRPCEIQCQTNHMKMKLNGLMDA